MIEGSLRPLLAVLASAGAVPLILAARRRPNVREGITIAAALTQFVVVASLVPGVLRPNPRQYETHLATLGEGLGPGLELALRVDALGLLFGALASLLWIVTSFYSVGYMRGLEEHAQTRYFAAFAASVSAAVGIAFSANLLTLFVFYELLTVATYPLVTHDESDAARRAGRKYLAYTFGGGVAVLAGTVLVYWLTGQAGTATTSFAAGGVLEAAVADPTLVGPAQAAFALLVIGFGVKAALMPLHSWLPDAMVAPTPVSGLLHAVAVVKSGVFGLARVVLDVYGVEAVADIGGGLPLATVAGVTLLAASVIALRQDNLKRRLAYSTVSQLSYIVLGLALLGEKALVGGLLHIPAHAFMKLTLFFCAGAIHVETHTDDISNMAGIGRRMPLTMAAFAVAAAGMAGIPLVAGFVSKWYLVTGAVRAGGGVFAAALLLSGVLNVAYFWPIVYQAYFESPTDHDPKPLIAGRLGGRAGTRTDGGPDGVADGATVVDEAPDDAGTADEDEGEDGDGDGDGNDDEDGTAGDPTAGEAADAVGTPDSDADGADDELEPVTDTGKVPGEVHGAREGHYGGPVGDEWERRDWRGSEASWFVLGPILATATGAVLLGVAPDLFVFLDVVQVVVDRLPGVVG